MRTIRPPKTTRSYIFTCRQLNCESMVEAQMSELYYEPAKYTMDKGKYTYRCPHCGTQESFDEDNLGFLLL